MQFAVLEICPHVVEDSFELSASSNLLSSQPTINFWTRTVRSGHRHTTRGLKTWNSCCGKRSSDKMWRLVGKGKRFENLPTFWKFPESSSIWTFGCCLEVSARFTVCGTCRVAGRKIRFTPPQTSPIATGAGTTEMVLGPQPVRRNLAYHKHGGPRSRGRVRAAGVRTSQRVEGPDCETNDPTSIPWDSCEKPPASPEGGGGPFEGRRVSPQRRVVHPSRAEGRSPKNCQRRDVVASARGPCHSSLTPRWPRAPFSVRRPQS